MADAGPEKGAQPVNGKKRQEKRPKQEEIFVSGRQALLEQPLPAEVDGAEPSSAPAEPYELPCTLNGIMAGFSGGSLGYVFGFGPHLFTHKGPGRLKASNYKGLESAKTFAIMGGLYAAVSCYMKRIRLKEDAFNGGAAGCATGLALGWSGGPRSALQSCVGFGLFSFVIDYFSNPGAATAASLPQASHPEQHKQARFTQTSRRPYAALQPIIRPGDSRYSGDETAC
ncbi:hypothetical protein WJX72_008146 [[Myrmecia] bisecta]|uniref:Mitochondrial import inner membrane translocase subunit TIM22 n=1 Tax=[Myrmecia] bisecta TaxID=41462 RepID=A0AAW1P908_9CHLO